MTIGTAGDKSTGAGKGSDAPDGTLRLVKVNDHATLIDIPDLDFALPGGQSTSGCQQDTIRRKRHSAHLLRMAREGADDLASGVGKAEISNDPAVQRQIIEDYPKKYLMARFGFHRPTQD